MASSGSSSTRLVPIAASRIYIQHIMNIYLKVISYGQPYFLGARVPLPTNLNLQQWDRIAITHGDKQVVQCMRFGFPVGYTSLVPTHTQGNHPLVNNHPKHLEAYIMKEINLGAILGPFPAPSFYPSCQINPLFTWAKKDSMARDGRVIM